MGAGVDRQVPSGVPKIRILVPPDGSPAALAAHVRKLQDEGRTVLYLAADRPHRQVVPLLEQAGADVAAMQFLDVVTCMDGRVPAERPPNAVFLPSPTMLEMMAMRVEQVASRLKQPVVLVDSLNTLVLYNGAPAVQEFTHYLANRLRLRGVGGDFVIRDTKEGRPLHDQVATFTDERLTLAAKEVA
jgi:hypothetical protein